MKRFVSTAMALLCAVSVFVALSTPTQAQALEVERWTAKSNEDGGNSVMGGISTRITWQGQADEGESIESISLDLSEDTSFEVESVVVTVLQGLDRLDYESTVTIEDGTTAVISFSEPTPEGALVMVEFYEAEFPAEGGTYGVSGSYVTGTGEELDIPDSDKTIEVVGTTISEQIAAWLNEQAWVETWTSNKFLNLFFNPAIAVTSIPSVFSGWLLALALVAISFPLSIPLGLMWSFLRMSKNRLIRAIGSTYINIVRGTPLFLQIYIAFFGLPLLGVSIDNFTLGVFVLLFNSSAYLAEIFRAGIQSIDKGQFEASRSLGMNAVQTMFCVIIPQTIKRVMPTMTSEFIMMYKDTSLLAAVGVMEMMMYAKTITASTGNVTPYIVAAGFYLLVTIPLTKFVNYIEDRMSDTRPRKSAK